MTALAYQPPMVLEMEYSGEKDFFEDFMLTDTMRFESGSFEKSNLYGEIRYEKQFMDENGVIYPVDDSVDTEIYANCDHNFIDGTFMQHIKNEDGSCITEKYKSKRCVECDYMVVGDLIGTETYTKCPH